MTMKTTFCKIAIRIDKTEKSSKYITHVSYFLSKYVLVPYIVQYLRETKKRVQSKRVVEATILEIDKKSFQRRNGAFTLVRIIVERIILRSNVINPDNTNSRHWKGTLTGLVDEIALAILRFRPSFCLDSLIMCLFTTSLDQLKLSILLLETTSIVLLGKYLVKKCRMTLFLREPGTVELCRSLNNCAHEGEFWAFLAGFFFGI